MRFVLGLSLVLGACTSSAMTSWEQWEKENKRTAKRGNLFVRCDPEDAEILLDEIPQGNCLDYVAKGLQINTSSHLRKITVTKAGYWPYEAMVVLDRSKVSLHVQLQRIQESLANP